MTVLNNVVGIINKYTGIVLVDYSIYISISKYIANPIDEFVKRWSLSFYIYHKDIVQNILFLLICAGERLQYIGYTGMFFWTVLLPLCSLCCWFFVKLNGMIKLIDFLNNIKVNLKNIFKNKCKSRIKITKAPDTPISAILTFFDWLDISYETFAEGCINFTWVWICILLIIRRMYLKSIQQSLQQIFLNNPFLFLSIIIRSLYWTVTVNTFRLLCMYVNWYLQEHALDSEYNFALVNVLIFAFTFAVSWSFFYTMLPDSKRLKLLYNNNKLEYSVYFVILSLMVMDIWRHWFGHMFLIIVDFIKLLFR